MNRKQRRQKEKTERRKATHKNQERVMVSGAADFTEDLKQLAMLFTRQEFGAAEAICRKILDKDRTQPVALNMLGVIASRAGAYEQAIDFIKMAIIEDPDYADPYNNLGQVYRSQGHHEEAIDAFRHALRLKPDNPDTYSCLGASLLELKRFPEVLEVADQAISLNSEHVDALNLMASVLFEIDRHEEGVEFINRVIALVPDEAQPYSARGALLASLGRYLQALDSFQTALSISPQDIRSLLNMGTLLNRLGRTDDAVVCFKNVLILDPVSANAHKALAFCYLFMGKIKEGLREYESRWQSSDSKLVNRDYKAPQWDGAEDLSDQTILLWPEQGPQDIMIWSSVIPDVVAKSGRCIVETLPKLVPLFTRSFPGAEVREAHPDVSQQVDDFDVHLAMGSLFHHFGQHLSRECEAFLVPDPVRVAYWKARLEELGPGPYIGISWKSPVVTYARAPNYTAIEDWAPVFKTPAVFINLQCGDGQNDLDHARQVYGVEIHEFEDLDLYDDLDEVAALSAALDLAISVSTAAAAITAGVGTETWLLSWKESYWNNLLFAPRGPKVINYERSITETWEATFAQMAQHLAERGLSSQDH